MQVSRNLHIARMELLKLQPVAILSTPVSPSLQPCVFAGGAALLHLASRHGQVDAMEMLVGTPGGNVSATTAEGVTAWHIAAHLGLQLGRGGGCKGGVRRVKRGVVADGGLQWVDACTCDSL